MSRPWHGRIKPGALIVLICLGVTAWLTASDWLWTWDRVVYDWQLRRIAHAPHPDIVIVSIDERSLIELGRWPWPRRQHAELLRLLDAAGVRAVVLDLILAEPDMTDPEGDQALVRALAAHGRVVLPVVAEQQGTGGQLMETLPLPELSEVAAALGHVDIDLDRDGMARSVYLQAGLGAPHWPHLALALLRLIQPEEWRQVPGLRNPEASEGSPYNWVRDHQIWLSFAGPPGSYPRVGYADLLSGRVPAERLRDKLVLIGVTVAAIDDLPTPMSAEAQLMPGVEIVANVLDTLLRQAAIAPIALPVRLGLNIGLIGLLLLVYARTAPRWNLLLTLLLIFAILWASLLLLHWQRLWLMPTALMVSLLLSYLLWSGYRLEAAVRFLNQELLRLDAEPGVVPPWDRPVLSRMARSLSPVELVQVRIAQVRAATTRLRSMRRFITDSLAQMTEGVIVCDEHCLMVMVNPQALTYIGRAADIDLTGQSVLPLLRALTPTEGADWPERLQQVLRTEAGQQFETRDAELRDFLVQLGPFTDREHQIRGVIITLADISPLKAGERERQEVLGFLSHDLRSPLASIIALTQIAEQRPQTDPRLLARIRQAAHRTLDLADSFVQLARAEQLDRAALTAVDLVFVAESAVELVRPQAEARSIRLSQRIPHESVWVRGEGALLERVLVNLLDNAIKYSPPGAEVALGLRSDIDGVYCWVLDTGRGIADQDRSRLFQRFVRLDIDPETRGVGLGLAFVKTVVDRHGGRIEVDSEPGRGSRFTVWLPAVPPMGDAA